MKQKAGLAATANSAEKGISMNYYTRKAAAIPAHEAKNFSGYTPKVDPDTYNPMSADEFVNPNLIVWEWRHGLIQNASDAIIRYIYWSVVLAEKHNRQFDRSARYIANRFGKGVSVDAVQSAVRRTTLFKRGGEIGDPLSQRPWKLTNPSNQNARGQIDRDNIVRGKIYPGQIDNPQWSICPSPVVNLTTPRGQFDNSIYIERIEQNIEDKENQKSPSSSLVTSETRNKSEAIETETIGLTRVNETDKMTGPSEEDFLIRTLGGSSVVAADLPAADDAEPGEADWESGEVAEVAEPEDSGSYYDELAPQIGDGSDLAKVLTSCKTLGIPITAEFLSSYMCVADVARLIDGLLQVAPPDYIRRVVAVSRLFEPYTGGLALGDWEIRLSPVIISRAGDVLPIHEHDWAPHVEDIVAELLARRTVGSATP